MVEIVKNINTNEWVRFLQSCNSATIYHTPEWKTFLEETFEYEPKYLFAKDSSDNLVGLLPLFYIKSWISGDRLCSLPFSHMCGAIGTPDSTVLLMNTAVQLFDSLKADYLEVRDQTATSNFKILNSFSTYVLELDPNPANVWKKLDKGSVRWAVTKSKKSGVEVIKTGNIEDVRKFYELNCITKKDLGVPCHPLAFFKNLFRHMDGMVSLYVAKLKGEVIGGGIMEYYNGSVIYGYGAANPGQAKMYPYNAFIWKSIEDACASGFKHFDFGRTSYGNEGLMSFKKRWGTQEYKLNYAYYPDIRKSLTNDRKSLKYSLFTGIIKHSPLPIYKQFSRGVFGHFG